MKQAPIEEFLKYIEPGPLALLTTFDGKKKNVIEKTIGRNIISFACNGSGGGGLIFCMRNIEPAMTTGKMKYGSGAARF